MYTRIGPRPWRLGGRFTWNGGSGQHAHQVEVADLFLAPQVAVGDDLLGAALAVVDLGDDALVLAASDLDLHEARVLAGRGVALLGALDDLDGDVLRGSRLGRLRGFLGCGLVGLLLVLRGLLVGLLL